jgi:sterol desaturase/sphingolipid hydroxylase (fatty acid hydroxylase superfamily)
MTRLLVLAISFVVLAAGFAFVEWRWRSVEGQRRFRKGFLTDAAYFLVTPLVGKPFTAIVVAISVLGLAALFGLGLTADQLRHLNHRDTLLGRQSALAQLVEFVVLADFIGYWSHRAFHRVGTLWKFHAIHHSSTELDWLSSVRVHPINEAISHTLSATPLLLLGFSPGAFAAYVPFLTLYAIMIHANVSWSFGPLRLVLASPTFHRWHHTSETEGLDKNFAGLLPIYDWLFGTLYLPKGVRPTRFGVIDTAVPEGILPQLVFPFRKPRRAKSVRGGRQRRLTPVSRDSR